MMASGDITRWAQLGWFKSKINGGVTHRESGLEFNTPQSGNQFEWFGPEPVNNSTHYQIQKADGINRYDFFMKGNWVASWNGVVNQTNYQVFGETHDKEDQLPGGVLNPVRFRNTSYFTGYYSSHIVNSAPNPDTLFGMAHPSSGRYDIWDRKCNT
jgi:hypothetical protein